MKTRLDKDKSVTELLLGISPTVQPTKDQFALIAASNPKTRPEDKLNAEKSLTEMFGIVKPMRESD